jgi:type VI secretion system secreted protein VgrG
MATYVQTDSPLAVTTPLGPDALLLVGFTGHEAVSHLFSFQLDLLAENRTAIAFDKLLGQSVTVRLAVSDAENRFFNGICNRFSQGSRGDTFTSYRMEIVPQFWLLTRRAQSRIFHHMTVPDILKKVLTGLDVTYEIRGNFEPRDYCVQYRETDFNFACRLMEEEGIYYFFKHANGSHKMVLANTPQSHPAMPGNSTIIYEELGGGNRDDLRIFAWEKVQELRSGKVTLWDHCFELPHRHLEADKTILDSVPVGDVTHKLKVGGNDKLELYDYPGGYAQRFDGIDKGGGEQPAELAKIYSDNKRTVGLRMEEEALPSLAIQADSNVREVVSGYKFTLDRHFNADGDYVITSVAHTAAVSDYRSNGSGSFRYRNHFTCIPFALPYRPARTTPKPFVRGTQTAAVVGPKGEEIFCDKYSRVKVQFHWDRQGQNNADNSCWCRVATVWAGKKWGVIHIPRVGHEVIVAFQEGDPDQPIIIGSVYNADHMPPTDLPKSRMVSGLRSNSTPGGGGYNGLIFDDTKGKEIITLHGQYDMSTTIEHDNTILIKNDEKATVQGNRTETVVKKETITIAGGREEHVDKGEKITVTGGREENADGGEKITIKDGRKENVTGDEDITIDGGQKIKITGARQEEVNGGEKVKITGDAAHEVTGALLIHSTGKLTGIGDGDVGVKGPNVTVQADSGCNIIGGSKLVLSGPGGSIVIDGSGVTIQGTVVNIN